MAQMSRRMLVQAGGLFAAGALVGGIVAGTVGASASAPRASAPRPGASTTYDAGDAAGPGAPGGRGGPGARGPRGMHRFGLGLTGTVRAVGTSSVTIQTSSGTKAYAVDADSDIDKNGEAKLSDLKVGDKVRFGVRPGTSTVAVLHAGDEAKNRPAGGMRGGHCDGPPPAAPPTAPSSGSTTG